MYEGGGLVLFMDGCIWIVANGSIVAIFKNWAKSLSSSRFCFLRRSHMPQNTSNINASAPPTKAPIIALVCDAPSSDITDFDECFAVEVDGMNTESVGNTDVEVIEVTNYSLLAKLVDNEEEIIEFEVVSVVAVVNPSWEDFGGKVSIEVDGSVNSPGIMDDDENAVKPITPDGLPCKLAETKAIELNADSGREC
ncbi:hypothetical protein B0H13DRAFT_1861688 [Mycena leptocephala]|nr:hypothetical protein B0H13DRAFT_1861688 [Mycena leptocephala]